MLTLEIIVQMTHIKSMFNIFIDFRKSSVVRSPNMALKRCDMVKKAYDVENMYLVSIRHENYSQLPNRSYSGFY